MEKKILLHANTIETDHPTHPRVLLAPFNFPIVKLIFFVYVLIFKDEENPGTNYYVKVAGADY